ncbi:hypothetical protein HOU02_gp373 [Caulobacter phage CcrBL9]|uniref:Uncharacterized protein n=1 Tax=Caulobacter phage CcrBL9 TaxID=2283270 RepID=A0A385EES5_9CAUD|nr:hypothetical protein HOU02_gp373 [Caulobacter phage CcrBL9]AXQ69352.1 hypothetical protein CcrBL9_gp328 [Caulobacter phage CcrBL9]
MSQNTHPTFRLQITVRDYLPFEVFGDSPEDVMTQFTDAVHRKAKIGGWSAHAQHEIDRIRPEWIEELRHGVTIEGEPF